MHLMGGCPQGPARAIPPQQPLTATLPVMGYSHGFHRVQVFPDDAFARFAGDTRRIIEAAEAEGICIAGWRGRGEPTVTADDVRFNGSERQPSGRWTTTEEIHIAWPSETAGLAEPDPDPIGEKVERKALDMVTQHVCSIDPQTGMGYGKCETFAVPRVYQPPEWAEPMEDGRWPIWCKTAFRPYDIAVTACLIALAYRMPPGTVDVGSDGTHPHFMPGRILAFNALGYGLTESFDELAACAA